MTRRMSITVPFFGEAERIAHCSWSLCGAMASPGDARVVIIDNDPSRSTSPYSGRLSGMDVVVLENGGNRGFPASCNQGWRSCDADIDVFLHNDVLMIENGWDRRVLAVFDDPGVALVGLCGALAATADGGRQGVVSNLYDAERHGCRHGGEREVAVFDSFAVAARRSFLEACGGWDEEYGPCHYADKDLSLASLSGGFRNVFVGVYCLHHGGVTSGARPYRQYADTLVGAGPGLGDSEVWARGRNRYLSKWKSVLPVQR